MPAPHQVIAPRCGLGDERGAVRHVARDQLVLLEPEVPLGLVAPSEVPTLLWTSAWNPPVGRTSRSR